MEAKYDKEAKSLGAPHSTVCVYGEGQREGTGRVLAVFTRVALCHRNTRRRKETDGRNANGTAMTEFLVICWMTVSTC